VSSGQRFYDENEAQEILRLAAHNQAPAGAMSRESLIQSAAELGISEADFVAAEAQYQETRKIELERAEFRAYKRRSFYSGLTSYVAVNAFLFAINLLKFNGHWWFLYPLLGWGLGMVFSAVGTFSTGSEDYQREFERWRARKARRSKKPETVDDVIERSIDLNGAEAKITIIKDVREATGMDLKDSKDAVEAYYDKQTQLRLNDGE
jgi:hypothetical protein